SQERTRACRSSEQAFCSRCTRGCRSAAAIDWRLAVAADALQRAGVRQALCARCRASEMSRLRHVNYGKLRDGDHFLRAQRRQRAPDRAGSSTRITAIRSGGRDQRVGVQSLARAFTIMEEIARNRDGIGLAELSKRVGLHNSTTFHLVKTMVSLGYVRQMKDSKRYRIGRPLFALAASALDEIEMTSLAAPVLDELARATGESAHFSVPMGDAVVVLARTGGPGAFQLNDRVGVVRPAHCTALGKIMLAALAPDQFERYLQRAELKPHTAKSITSAER